MDVSVTPRLLSVAIFVPVLLSGCAFPGGGAGAAFDPVDVPVWESGYSWSYDIVSSSQSSGFGADGIGSDGDSDRGSLTMKVVNTTKQLDGEPVYVVSMGESFDHPIFSGNMQALTKTALQVAAIGYRNDYYGHGGEDDPCVAATPLYRVEPDEQFPTLRFPLDDGATWTGSLGVMEPVAMDYTMNVHGLVDVDVPAGSFKAVYVTTDFQPGELPEEAQDEIGKFDLSLRSEQWYSPDVRYLVKHVFTASASATEEGERYQFAYRTTAVLTNYSLEAAPEEPAPEVVSREESSRAERYYPSRIVSDTEFPVNVADGPVTARFSMEQTNGRDVMWQSPISKVDAFDTLDYNNETHEIVWTVTSYGTDYYGEEKTYKGDILELPFEKGGEYQIRAAIQAKTCGLGMLGDAYGTATAFWSKTFSFETGTGDLPQTMPVAQIPVESNAMDGIVGWVRQPKVGYSADQANVLVRGPDGRTQSFSTNSVGEANFGMYPAGLYDISWQTTGLPSVGETIDLTVTVNYGSMMWH